MRRAFLEQRYRTPSTTTEAFNFGHSAALAGHERLSESVFLSRQETPHPFPSSLWRAYKLGHAAGSEQRQQALLAAGLS